jgi:hypothetical protein
LTLDPLKQLHRNERAAKQHKTKYHLALATIIMSLIPTNKASVAYDIDYVLCPDVESQARSSVSGNCTISTSESASKIRKELELERIPREWFIVLMTLLLLQLAVSVVLIMNLPAKKEAFTCAVGVLSRILTIGILVLLRCLDYAVRSLLHLRIDKQSFDYVRTILSHK